MKKKILLSSIILGTIAPICVVLLVVISNNTKLNESKISEKITFTKQESIIGQNDINIVSTNVEPETEDNEIKDTEEKIIEETKEEIKQKTQDKQIENTQEKTTSKVTKETSGTVETFQNCFKIRSLT